MAKSISGCALLKGFAWSRTCPVAIPAWINSAATSQFSGVGVWPLSK